MAPAPSVTLSCPSHWLRGSSGAAAVSPPCLFHREQRSASVIRQTWSQPFRLYYLDHHNNGCGAATRPARVLERCCRHIRPPPARCARMLRRPARLAPMSQMRSALQLQALSDFQLAGCIPFSIYTLLAKGSGRCNVPFGGCVDTGLETSGSLREAGSLRDPKVSSPASPHPPNGKCCLQLVSV